MVEGTIDDGSATPFTAVYVIRDRRIRAHMSDRELLEQLGLVDRAEPADRTAADPARSAQGVIATLTTPSRWLANRS